MSKNSAPRILFHHRGSFGDIIYSLPTVISLGGGILWISRDRFYHPIKSLLIRQPYIFGVTSHIPVATEDFVNLDRFRKLDKEGMKTGKVKHLAEYYLEVFNKEYDLSTPWLENVPEQKIANIIIHRTRRYHSKTVLDWRILTPVEDQIVFVGWEKDYRDFTEETGLFPQFCQCEDVLAFASIIKGSKLFIGNQSLGFALAESMKHNRILEVFDLNPNCMPKSSNGLTQLTEEILYRWLKD